MVERRLMVGCNEALRHDAKNMMCIAEMCDISVWLIIRPLQLLCLNIRCRKSVQPTKVKCTDHAVHNLLWRACEISSTCEVTDNLQRPTLIIHHTVTQPHNNGWKVHFTNFQTIASLSKKVWEWKSQNPVTVATFGAPFLLWSSLCFSRPFTKSPGQTFCWLRSDFEENLCVFLKLIFKNLHYILFIILNSF